MPNEFKSLEGFIPLFFPIFLAIGGTIAVILASIGRFKDKRMENLQEASTTWRELAESREADNRAKDAEIVVLKEEVQRLRRRNNYLWDQLTTAQKTNPKRGKGPQFWYEDDEDNTYKHSDEAHDK